MAYEGKAKVIPTGVHNAVMTCMIINGEVGMGEKPWWLDGDGDILMESGEVYIHIIREGEYIGVYGGERYRADKVNGRIPVAEFAKALGMGTEDEILKLRHHIAGLENELNGLYERLEEE